MNEKVLVSVIIPVYNAGPYLDETFESVLSQTVLQQGVSLEVSVYDDGSTDDSVSQLVPMIKKIFNMMAMLEVMYLLFCPTRTSCHATIQVQKIKAWAPLVRQKGTRLVHAYHPALTSFSVVLFRRLAQLQYSLLPQASNSLRAFLSGRIPPG